MIDVADLRIFVCTTPTNMTYSFDSLMGRVQEVFDQDPTSGHLFLFFNRRRDRIKILFWDHDGFCDLVQTSGSRHVPDADHHQRSRGYRDRVWAT